MLAWILVDEVAFEDVIHEHRELPGGGGDGVRFARAGGEPTIKRAERGGGTAERRGRQSKRVRVTIRGWLVLLSGEGPTGDLVLRRERQPRGEVLRRGPASHVGPDFPDQL